jgi:hypothetical protein
MSTPALPPTELDIALFPNGNFAASFATQGDMPFLPGVFEVGSSSISLVRSNSLTLDVQGQLRMLKRPDGQWSVRTNLNLRFAEGPFTYAVTNLPPRLLDLEFMSIRTGTQSRLQISRAVNGTFSVEAANIQLHLLERQFSNLSGSANTQGLLTLTAAKPAVPFQAGPFQLDADGDSFVRWNVKTGSLLADISPSKLKASNVDGWPAGGIDFPGISFNSAGDFSRKIVLPSFSFDGIATSGGQNLSKNHLLFERQAGVLRLRIRDEHDFFLSKMKLNLDIDSNGNAAGSFHGNFAVNTPIFGRLNFAAISLQYDTAGKPYQFQGRTTLIGNDFGVYFGSGGARFCHLFCDPGPGLAPCSEGLFCLF